MDIVSKIIDNNKIYKLISELSTSSDTNEKLENYTEEDIYKFTIKKININYDIIYNKILHSLNINTNFDYNRMGDYEYECEYERVRTFLIKYELMIKYLSLSIIYHNIKTNIKSFYSEIKDNKLTVSNFDIYDVKSLFFSYLNTNIGNNIENNESNIVVI